MKFAVSRNVTVFVAGIVFIFAPVLFGEESCKCPRSPGPGGGVQCAKNQVATCDPSSGECNCTCDSIEGGKSKDYYEALILSKTLHTAVEPTELSAPQYRKVMSSFRRGDEKGTFRLDKGGTGRSTEVNVGVPDWLDDVLVGKGGVSFGPGAGLQNCPNGICITGNNNGSATVNNLAAPQRHLADPQRAAIHDFFQSLPDSIKVFVKTIDGNGEAQRYAQQFQEEAVESGRSGNPKAVILGSFWHPIPVGLVIATHSDDDVAAAYRDKLVDKLASMGIRADRRVGDWIGSDQLYVVVGEEEPQ